MFVESELEEHIWGGNVKAGFPKEHAILFPEDFAREGGLGEHPREAIGAREDSGYKTAEPVV